MYGDLFTDMERFLKEILENKLDELKVCLLFEESKKIYFFFNPCP